MALKLESLVAIIVLPVFASNAGAQTNNGRSSEPRSLSPKVETYEAVSIDAQGNLQIVTTAGRITTVAKEAKQTTLAEPFISPDHTAVGATGEYTNCCTSYDIPLQLIVYSDGRVHRYSGELGLAIFDWHFVDGGRRVAFGAQTVHFGCEVHWRLVDIRTDRLVNKIAIPEPCGQIPDPKTVKVPAWVQPPAKESRRFLLARIGEGC